MIKFEWDAAKAAAIRKKHVASFEETQTVFYDEFALQFYDDEENTASDDRFLMLGKSAEARISIICHCERRSGRAIRIILARKATKAGRKFYPGGEP